MVNSCQCIVSILPVCIILFHYNVNGYSKSEQDTAVKTGINYRGGAAFRVKNCLRKLFGNSVKTLTFAAPISSLAEYAPGHVWEFTADAENVITKNCKKWQKKSLAM